MPGAGPSASVPRSTDAIMRTPRCLLLAALIAGLGLALRLGLPVAPVDAPFRAVLQAYATPDPSAADPSNTAETSAP
jgi:energy-converting hydrogenase Eha subunit A